MKNIHVLVLMAIIAVIGSMIHIEPANAWGNETPLITECFHVTNGVRDSMPYTGIVGGGTCPPCSSNSQCANSVNHSAHKSTPNLPPSMCTEEGVDEW